MKETQRGERFAVFDDFLSEAEFNSAIELMDRATLAPMESVVAPGVDGPALRSKGISLPASIGDGSPNARPALYTQIARALYSDNLLFGRPETDWNWVSFTFWQYPSGSRLGWHNDAGRGRQGEFIYYMHRSWDVSWGGELMLVDQDPGVLDDADAAGSEGFAAKMNELLLKLETSPIAILPKPNRLVMVRSNTIHTITRVDAAAGDSKRCTLTGFAYREGEGNLSGANREEMEAAFLGSVR